MVVTRKGYLPTLLLLPCLLQVSASSMECMSGGEIDCYDCNSWSDSRCHDPFNYTGDNLNMPSTKVCEGCCVKLVRHAGTAMESVRRTCTDEMDINLFIVGHVCMTEGGSKGWMCFCEEDRCNTAPRQPTHSSSSSALLFLLLLHNLSYTRLSLL